MSELRLALLIIGLFIIGAVLVWGWLRSRPSYAGDFIPPAGDELPPSGIFGDRGSPEELELERMRFFGLRARREPVATSELESVKVSSKDPDPVLSEPPPEQPDPVIISVTVMPEEGERFDGSRLLEVFENAGLYYGDLQIFHAPVDLEKTDGPVLFSVANIVEPGMLVPDEMGQLRSPGLILFGRLPARVPGMDVLNHMVATGRYLAKTLGGHLCDGKRRLLTEEGVEEMRARVERDVGNRIEVPDDGF